MKKIGGIILILSLMTVLMACPPETEPEKVIAEQYRGTYKNDTNSNNPNENSKIEFTSNKMIITRNNNSVLTWTAWTEGNVLITDDNNSNYGKFENGKFMYQNIHSYTKQ